MAEKPKGRKDKRQKRQKAEKPKGRKGKRQKRQNAVKGNCLTSLRIFALTFNLTKNADILKPNISKSSGRRALNILAQRELQVSEITYTVYLDMYR